MLLVLLLSHAMKIKMQIIFLVSEKFVTDCVLCDFLSEQKTAKVETMC